jgi:uncharacterized protein (TIGR00255 family)
MIRSMTGYGEASCEAGGVHYFLEVRSLNGRYFKATIRLPDEFQGLEAEIETELRHKLTRGSVTLTATCSDSSGNAAHTINLAALNKYIDQLLDVPAIQDQRVNMDAGSLLSLPGVLQPPGNEEDRHEKARAAFLSLVKKACDALLAMRQREGQALREDLLSQRVVIEQQMKTVIARSPKVIADYEQRLKTRMEAMLADAGLKVNPGDLIREIAVYAEKSDISEEITRLTGHLEQYGQLLSGQDSKPVGRTLDFLTQEMLREANTMASKSGDTEISRAIVEIKGAIDRIKEQVQNIE